MAYNLIAPPLSSLSNETSFFYSSLSPPNLSHLRIPQNLYFPLKLHRAKPSFHICAKLSSQEPALNAVNQDSIISDANAISPSKSYVWVNPKSPVASKLRQKANDYWFASLVKIAESLNSCAPLEDSISNVLGILGDEIVEHDAVIILNNISNSETAPLVLDYLLKRLKLGRKVVLYNVTLKVFRKSKDLVRSHCLFQLMLERGIKPDNFTFSTIISCARLASLPEKAIEWYKKMPSFGCELDPVTCSVMIDVYRSVGHVEAALSLYDRAKSKKLRVGALAFAALIRIYRTAGNFDGCLTLYEEMRDLGVRPEVSVYNSLLDAMGSANRPWKANTIYRNMLKNRIEPTLDTYAALIRVYGKSRYAMDAISVYREMKKKGFELSVLLYNTLLSTCADVGFIDEATEIFQDMKSSENCKPDIRTYASLIKINSCHGKVKVAEAVLKEMLEAGLEPNIFVLISLIQCYGKAGRTDDVVRTFDQVLELGTTLDERFCVSLLNVLIHAPKEELGKLTTCIEKVNPKLANVVKLLVEENIDGENIRKEASELFESIGADFKKPYCNCLIDICVWLNQPETARELLDLGLSLEIYTDIMSRTPTQWSLHVKGFSLGAALTAMHVWMNDLCNALTNGEEFPELLGICTGHGKHNYTVRCLAANFESHLEELNAPFYEAPDQVGWFLATKAEAITWLESRQSQEAVLA